jgi:hypothetical protein
MTPRIIEVTLRGKLIGLATSPKRARELIRWHAEMVGVETYYVKISK